MAACSFPIAAGVDREVRAWHWGQPRPGGGTAMRFFGIVTLTIALLQREGRITYGALKRGFDSMMRR